MSHRILERRNQSASPELPLDRRDLPWLAVPLVVGLVVAVVYLATNAYPAYGAGLYTATADQIRANGYALPAKVPGYTAEGVPFAYPPLAFYGLAVLRDLGAGTFATARLLPPAVVVTTLVPAYLIGRDLLGGRRRGAAAATLLATTPQILEWHVSAGGVVRAPAFLFALCSAYAGVGLFRDHNRSWIPVALTLFCLTLLTHPTYALFVVVTLVVFWAGYDRSLVGFGRGAVVGFGGVALAAPWWVTVGLRHGFDVFAAAAGTHGGVGGGVPTGLAAVSAWMVGLGIAAILAVAGGWRVLPAWLVASEVLFAQPRFAGTVGVFVVVAAAVTVADGLADRRPLRRAHWGRASLALLLVTATVGVGVVTAEFAGARDETTPEFVDDDDVQAMEWAERSTSPAATFVVLGDAAEWFPLVADRTILVGPWGMEWRGHETYYRHLNAYRNLSRCDTAACVTGELAAVGVAPDYLYVPRGEYTVRGHPETNGGSLARSLNRSTRYEHVFANDGVIVYRVGDEASSGTDRSLATREPADVSESPRSREW